jgi:hypothetical protein
MRVDEGFQLRRRFHEESHFYKPVILTVLFVLLFQTL